MDVERIIDDIEQLQEMFEAPDTRPLSASDISAANRRHDEMLGQTHMMGIHPLLGTLVADGFSPQRTSIFVFDEMIRLNLSTQNRLILVGQFSCVM